MANTHGRSWEEWQALVDAAFDHLKRKARLKRTSNYTDVNRAISESTGQSEFDFTNPEGRNAMGDLLGEVVERSLEDSGVMLSALVMYLNENRPGAGFYNLAQSKGLLDKEATPDEKEAFWIDQCNKAYEAYDRGARHPLRRRG